jgi:myo-inositol-1(or 4)-monophosphatase
MNKDMLFLNALVIKVGKELLTYFKPEGIPAVLKSDKTPITIADTTADQLITEAIRSKYPNDQILSEESSLVLDSVKGSTWVIDPLDGTTNFSLGFPYWGVSIARITNGYPEIAAVNFPAIGELYTAEIGKGSYFNGELMKNKASVEEHKQKIMVCSGNAQNIYKIKLPYKKRTVGSAAYDYCIVARGTSIFGIQNKSKIWDLAAGFLILKEAGGDVRFINEMLPFPLRDKINYNDYIFPSFMASSQEILEFSAKRIEKRS